jgi:hypothetical protein
MPDAALCPSGRPRTGALITGIVGPDGKVAYIRPALPVSAEWLERGAPTSDLETRFRFAEPCVSGACAQWGNGGCRIGKAAASVGASLMGDLPECGIRPSCRWHRQEGDAACRACPLVRRQEAV